MKRNVFTPILTALLLVLTLTSCSVDRQPEITYVKGAGKDAESALLKNRDLGSCKMLEGAVHFTAVFVSDRLSSWNEEDALAAMTNIKKALDTVSAEAERYSVELTVTLSRADAKITSAAPAEPDYYVWLNEALKSAGLGTSTDVDARLREEHSADAAPVIFMFSREGRAYASVASDAQFEYCVAYTSEEDSLVHEIMHMFGARDLYYPEEVKRLSAEMLGDSVMIEGAEDIVDPFTAYLVGWHDEPSEQARKFLDSLTVTEDDIEKALAFETYTGFATKEFSVGKYTGELVYGIPDGRGKMVYNDGHVYEGEWKANLPHGTGTFTWASGSRYEGEWKKGKRDGTGTYTWADGTKYVGGYSQDEMHGSGVITYADGRTVSGTWNMGQLS